MSAVWSRAAYRGIMLPRSTGIQCTECNERFVIQQGQAVAASIITFLLGIGIVSTAVVFWPWQPLAEPVLWLLIGVGVVAVMLLQNWAAQLFCNVRRLDKGEIAKFPLGEKDTGAV